MALDRGRPSGDFSPEQFPGGTLEEMAEWLGRMFSNVSNAFKRGLARELEVAYAEPAKPRDGMIRLADGTEWNPGGGEGVYVYYNAQWNKL